MATIDPSPEQLFNHITQQHRIRLDGAWCANKRCIAEGHISHRRKDEEHKMSISDDPLFNRHSREPIYYLAHPLAPDDRFTFQQNMNHVVEMMKFFYKECNVRVVAPYHTMCLALDDDSPEDRRIGLEVDLCLVRKLKRIILVGHKISSGMKDELLAAGESYEGAVIHNFTGWTRNQIKFYFDSIREWRGHVEEGLARIVQREKGFNGAITGYAPIPTALL